MATNSNIRGNLASNEKTDGPLVGVPYRIVKEEDDRKYKKIQPYLDAVRRAGGVPVPISLHLSAGELLVQARGLDAFVLPGSPADVHPLRYGAAAHPKCSFSDPRREATDFALFEHAFAESKPILAICYGIQSLNVYLGGTLIQDIPSEIRTPIGHSWEGRKEGQPEPSHAVRLAFDSRLAQLAGTGEALVNSSHHQSIREPGRGLRIAAQAPDGVIEAVEWAGEGAWVTGVQWHPERMTGNTLAQALFRELVAAARGAHIHR